ncbi:MAG: hypothetical protein JXQ75_06925 [Phycisphaerae bacterium]|nr:hypothetical protein [Phycisphaerae bacterium]
MTIQKTLHWCFLGAFLTILVATGSDCPPSGLPTPNGGDGDGGEPLATLETFATNTGGGSGIALRPSDGALYMVNSTGLFGPITDGTDVSTLTPIGATNMADAAIFTTPQDALALGITNAGEFWIGTQSMATLAVVPAGGGDAAPFGGLSDNTPNIFPETFALVPAGFNGAQMFAGNLLVGAETTYSRLDAIDVEGEQCVTAVDNPDTTTNRLAHHLTFGLDGVLYGSRGLPGLTYFGIQTIATDARPTALSGTLGVSADTFVARSNGDLVMRGSYQESATQTTTGIILYTAATQQVEVGLEMPAANISESDEMVITTDGTILLSLPNRNEIVRVVVD